MALTQSFIKQAAAGDTRYRPAPAPAPSKPGPTYHPGLGVLRVGVSADTRSAPVSTSANRGGYYQAPPPDPYAKWGGKAGYDQAVADYGNLKNTTFGSMDRAVGDAETPYHSGILDYLDTAKAGRRTLDAKYTQNELAREHGEQGVQDMVRHGIQSAGVMMANAGGGSSESAREGFARAYGTLGREEMSGVNNQAAQVGVGLQAEEENFDAANNSQIRKTQESKVNTVNGIVNSVVTQLAALNEKAASASLPDRVNIEAEAARIKQQALDALGKYDAELTNGVGALKPKDAMAVKSDARSQLQAGVVPEDAFDFTSTVPTELQGTGDFASSLPIFVSPTAKKQQQAVA